MGTQKASCCSKRKETIIKNTCKFEVMKNKGILKFFAGLAIGIGIGFATNSIGIGIGIGIAFGAAFSQGKFV